jgi:hypothetical protein
MKTTFSLLVFLVGLSLAIQAQPGACCSGLAPDMPGVTRLPMVSKFPLDVRQQCPAGMHGKLFRPD